MIQSPAAFKAISVPDKHIVSRQEYARLAKPLQHYHHVTFGLGLDINAVCSPASPIRPNPVEQALLNEFRRVLEGCQKRKFLPFAVWPLRAIRFSDLYKLRFGDRRAQFFDSLHTLHTSARSDSEDEYFDALGSHADLVISSVGFNRAAVATEDLAAELKKSVFADSTDPNKVGTTARISWGLVRNLLPAVWRMAQLDWFFRDVADISHSVDRAA